jgi:hypothetical protein
MPITYGKPNNPIAAMTIASCGWGQRVASYSRIRTPTTREKFQPMRWRRKGSVGFTHGLASSGRWFSGTFAAVEWDSPAVRKVTLLACVAVILGAVGPWQTSLLVDRAGLDGDGVITLVLALGAGALVLDRPPGSNWLMIAGLLAVGSAFVAGYDLKEIYTSEQTVFGEEVRLVSPGWGLWLTTVGSVVLAAGATALWVDAPESEANS